MAQTQEVATKPRQTAAEVFYSDLDAYTPNLKDALPADIPVERFKRVLVTAVSTNPELLYADRRSLFNASMRCAVDGLIPDGRQAALVVYRTDVKTRDPQTGIDHVRKMDVATYLPMVAGLRERMRKSGEVASAVAEAVFEKDHFRYRLGDDAFIEHEPPALGVSRGAVIGAYAIIRLKNGEVIRDVLDRSMIEAARNVSRAKNSPMWTNFYWEGAKKTALRRAAKQAPFSSELRQVLDRDEEEPAMGPGLLPRQPEPQRDQYQISRSAEPTGPEFAVVDLDGVENIYGSAGAACEALQLCLHEAAQLGPERLDGWWESNQNAVDFLHAAGYADVAINLSRAYDAQRKQVQAPRRARQTRASEQPAPEPPIEEQAPHAPLAGIADDDPFGLAEVDHRMPPTEPPPSVEPQRSGLEIAVPLKAGKRDWRTWALALFGVKVKRCTSSNELADLLGANEQNLAEARAALGPADLAELERLIAEQWQKVPPMSITA
jgi:phage RecT family recombinase